MEHNEESNESLVVTLKKIPLEAFIQMLVELYDKGADYIDIIGKPDEEQDVISIVVRFEYIDPENNGFESDENIIVSPEDFDKTDIKPTDLI